MPTSSDGFDTHGPLRESLEQAHSRLLLLPELNQLLTGHTDIREAIPAISAKLHSALPHQWCGLCLVESDNSSCRVHAQHSAGGIPGLPSDFAFPVEGCPAGEAILSKQPVVVSDLAQTDSYPELTAELLRLGWRSGCWVPLQTAGKVLGTFWLGSSMAGAFQAEDVHFLNDTSNQIALAVAQQLATQQLESLQRSLAGELRGIESGFENSSLHPLAILLADDEGSVREANDSFLNLMGFTRTDMQAGKLRRETISPEEYRALDEEILSQVRARGFSSPVEKEYLHRDGTRIPVMVTVSQSEDRRHCIAWVVDLRERKRLEREGRAISANPPSDGAPIIVSAAMREIHSQIERSAPTEATILLLGETGTGKELMARTIHELSLRKDRPFIKVNCAAIPSGLLESELFGHEKGAFTGALARKTGRIELANQGTLFLDEVGDIPLELQPKLLRMLQEHEFERLGGTQTIRVDVRVVAATNRDLKRMVSEGLFRLDLFYRLNVFPVQLPPLRERREAIPLLVDHFVRKFNQQFRREIHTVPAEVMANLQQSSWPGNIRELENVIERAVILSPGSDLRVSPRDLETPEQQSSSLRSLWEVEREHIIRALREAHGRVGGRTGAAALLGLKRTTLQYKMKKLGVARRRDF